MALNVKAAIIICLGFIGGMSWVVRQFDGPLHDARTNVITIGSPLAAPAATPGPGQIVEAGLERRAELARQFACPSPVDAEITNNTQPEEIVAVEPPLEPAEAPVVLAALPPAIDAEPSPIGEALAMAEAVEPEGVDDEASLADAAWRTYQVMRGDSLAKIARREWESSDWRLVQLIVEANPALANRKDGRILVGEELRLPDAVTAQRVAAGELSPRQAVLEQAELGPAIAEANWYTIRRHDTLAGIARRFLNDGKRWREIADLNESLNPHRIVPGTRIKLPPLMRMVRG